MEGKDWAELLKYPLTIIVAIAAIVIGSMVLGLIPTSIEVGNFKVDLETELRSDLVLQTIGIEETIKELVENEINKRDVQVSSPSSYSLSSLSIIPTPITSLDTVSDKVADIAKITTKQGQGTVFKSNQGYIWIGNFNTNSKKFERTTINTNNLKNVKIGEIYVVNSNMVIRENSPVKNINYYKGEKKVGLAVKGTKIKIIEQPEVKELSKNKQYWVKIEVLE
jgi:hypothetical protein